MGNSPSTEYPIIVNEISQGKKSRLVSFLENGGDPNQPFYDRDDAYFIDYSHHGKYLIHIAAHYGEIEAVKLLLEAGVDINMLTKNTYRETPLISAVETSKYSTVEYLLKNGADPNIHDGGGLTALHIATSKNDLEMIGILVRLGADVNCKNPSNGNTPLHNASSKGKRRTVECLLSNGADPTILNNDEDTPLDLATNYGTAKAIETKNN